MISYIKHNPAQLYLCSITSIGAADACTELPQQYIGYNDVFSKDIGSEIPDHGPDVLAIELEEGKKALFGLLYGYLEAELVVLQEYIANSLAEAGYDTLGRLQTLQSSLSRRRTAHYIFA